MKTINDFEVAGQRVLVIRGKTLPGLTILDEP
jgi:hypothetical protein